MRTTRRRFLHTSAAAALGARLVPSVLGQEPVVAEADERLRILVLGGTGFIGPHLVRYALARGHVVTLFNRGKTNTHLFPDVAKLKGDRTGDISALEGHEWDVVIDNSANDPAWVRASAQLLKDAAGLYLFTSSRSAYSDLSAIGLNEDTAPLYDDDPSVIDEGKKLPFGRAKALAEKELKRAFGDRSSIVRPGLIVGPGDTSDRFTYWPVRIDRGGEVLAPGDPDHPVMFIDVRDLAEWYVHLVEQQITGVFNALGPAAPLSMAELLYGIRAITAAPVSFTWVSTEFLQEQKVRPYMHLPLWMPALPGYEGFNRFDLSRPHAAGLKYRPLAQTARDTLDYHFSRPEERRAKLRAGISAEREAELLLGWHAEQR